MIAEVFAVVGKTEMMAIIAADAAGELRLKKGERVAALVNSTIVMIERLDTRDCNGNNYDDSPILDSLGLLVWNGILRYSSVSSI